MYDARYFLEQEVKYVAALKSVHLDNRSRVLDLGCGTGLFFAKIASLAEFFVGIDLSRQLLLQARERSKLYSNAFVVVADADHLPFIKAAFSHVFAFTVFQNMPKPQKTLLESKRVANNNALFVLTGLKKTISLEKFGMLLENANLTPLAVTDEEGIACFVLVAVNRGN
jgi:ubiquinone/menaquinone biosynthesis C-methylase UbiE